MNGDEITNLLSIVLMIMIGILMVLVLVYFFVRSRLNKPKREESQKLGKTNKATTTKTPSTQGVEYHKQSIFSFMEFDKIEDNMIVKKEGRRYLMVIECQGVNYDLMSGLEKNGVEQGFIQFLNTLRYPIQLYIQTRTVNLESGIIRYKERVEAIKDRLAKKQMELYRKQGMGYTEEELRQARLEVTREKNLFEYGQDIVSNTERMSLNKNILRKHYYIIIEYMPEDVSNMVKEEINNLAFSELYTKAQTIISSLSVCGINSKILDSTSLVELLYIAYNRDEAEVYDLNKALRAGYDEMYVTAPDVLSKRMKELDRRIEEEANKLANDVVMETMAENEEAKRVKQKEAEMDELIAKMAKLVLRDNENYIGRSVAKKASEKIDKRKTKSKAKNKEVEDEKE